MSDLAPSMTDLKGKIEQLVKLHRQLKSENDELIRKIQVLENELNVREHKIEELESAQTAMESAHHENHSSMITDTKEKISELVQEIDSCIALLNK